MSRADINFDFDRAERIGLDEAVLAAGKTPAQITAILEGAAERQHGVLITRLSGEALASIAEHVRSDIDYHDISATGFFGPVRPVSVDGKVVIVSAGTADAPTAYEAARTLRHAGVGHEMIADAGVAGLWRLTSAMDRIRTFPIAIVVAGMDAAMASVLGGLYSGSLICVPTSVGYGVSDNGRAALNAMLASCAPGLTVCNIDSGYGAACAALRVLNSMGAMQGTGKKGKAL
jgi:pyridinium-3,5-biscarboxylic acid mononucleotide synthase